MNTNWVTSAIVRTMAQKRSVFGSSSGASTSSSMQNGAGLSSNKAKTSAIAVIAFSPPDSRWIVVLRLPGGCAMTCTPASRISSPVRMSRAWPPPKSVGNSWPKLALTLSKVCCSSSRDSRSIWRIAVGGGRLLRGGACSKLLLQRRLDGCPVDLRALRRQLSDERLLLRDLRLQVLSPARELGETLPAGTLGKAGLLRGAFRRVDAFARRHQRKLCLVARLLCGVARTHGVGKPSAAGAEVG